MERRARTDWTNPAAARVGRRRADGRFLAAARSVLCVTRRFLSSKTAALIGLFFCFFSAALARQLMVTTVLREQTRPSCFLKSSVAGELPRWMDFLAARLNGEFYFYFFFLKAEIGYFRRSRQSVLLKMTLSARVNSSKSDSLSLIEFVPC